MLSKVLIGILVAGVGGIFTWYGTRPSQQSYPWNLASATMLKQISRRGPIFIARTSASKGGVVVIRVFVNRQGTVDKTELLEAPDSQIGAAVLASVSRWTFRPHLADGKAAGFYGKLILYADKGAIVDPNRVAFAGEAPNSLH